jgi:hypothetical protein
MAAKGVGMNPATLLAKTIQPFCFFLDHDFDKIMRDIHCRSGVAFDIGE